MAAQAYLKLGEVSVESGKLKMAVLIFRPFDFMSKCLLVRSIIVPLP